MTPALLPLCEDCDQEARAPRSRPCNPCREARKAAQKATWQRENRDQRRAEARPIRVPAGRVGPALAEARAAVAALQSTRTRLAPRADQSPRVAAIVDVLDQASAALTTFLRALNEAEDEGQGAATHEAKARHSGQTRLPPGASSAATHRPASDLRRGLITPIGGSGAASR